MKIKTGKAIADKFNDISVKLESNFRLFLCEKSHHLILRDCKHETYVGVIRNIYSTESSIGEWHFYPITSSCWSILAEFCVDPILKEAGVDRFFDLVENKDVKSLDYQNNQLIA